MGDLRTSGILSHCAAVHKTSFRVTEPLFGCRVPQRICSSVGFPAPLRPMMPAVSPLRTSKDAPRKSLAGPLEPAEAKPRYLKSATHTSSVQSHSRLLPDEDGRAFSMTNVKQNAIIFRRRVDRVEYRGQKQAEWNSTDPLILGNVNYVKKLDPDIPT